MNIIKALIHTLIGYICYWIYVHTWQKKWSFGNKAFLLARKHQAIALALFNETKVHWRIRLDIWFGYTINKLSGGRFSDQIQTWFDEKYPMVNEYDPIFSGYEAHGSRDMDDYMRRIEEYGTFDEEGNYTPKKDESFLDYLNDQLTPEEIGDEKVDPYTDHNRYDRGFTDRWPSNWND